MLNTNVHKMKPKQHVNLRTAQTCVASVGITVHNCRTQHSIKQFYSHNLPFRLHTIIIAQMRSVGGKGIRI